MQRQRFIRLIVVAFLICPIGSAFSAQKIPSQGRTAVLTGKAGQTLFKQCSRASPRNDGATWIPGVQDIQTLEAQFPLFLRSQKLPSRLSPAIVGDYYRQCVGFTRSGHRLIYINAFAPRVKVDMERTAPLTPHKKPFDWHHDPVMVCDGGDAFFGVEYDVEKKQFHELKFNGR